jgi:hypothetical protein
MGQDVCRRFQNQFHRPSPLRPGSLCSALTALMLSSLAALRAHNKPTPIPAGSLVETGSEKIFSPPRRSGKNKLNLTLGDTGAPPIRSSCVDTAQGR